MQQHRFVYTISGDKCRRLRGTPESATQWSSQFTSGTERTGWHRANGRRVNNWNGKEKYLRSVDLSTIDGRKQVKTRRIINFESRARNRSMFFSFIFCFLFFYFLSHKVSPLAAAASNGDKSRRKIEKRRREEKNRERSDRLPWLSRREIMDDGKLYNYCFNYIYEANILYIDLIIKFLSYNNISFLVLLNCLSVYEPFIKDTTFTNRLVSSCCWIYIYLSIWDNESTQWLRNTAVQKSRTWTYTRRYGCSEIY